MKLLVVKTTKSVDTVLTNGSVRARVTPLEPIRVTWTIEPMTDLGTSRHMQDGSRSSKGLRVLSRIAEVLERPVADFYRHDANAVDSDTPSAAECELMLTAFLRVRDPELRQRVIEMMRAYSDH